MSAISNCTSSPASSITPMRMAAALTLITGVALAALILLTQPTTAHFFSTPVGHWTISGIVLATLIFESIILCPLNCQKKGMILTSKQQLANISEVDRIENASSGSYQENLGKIQTFAQIAAKHANELAVVEQSLQSLELLVSASLKLVQDELNK